MEHKHSSRAGTSPSARTDNLPPRGHVMKRGRLVLIVVGIVLALLAVRTVVANVVNQRHLDSLVEKNERSYVHVVEPKLSANGGKLVLPGTLRGYVEAPIYARASGYVKRWDVDIGAHVSKARFSPSSIRQTSTRSLPRRRRNASRPKPHSRSPGPRTRARSNCTSMTPSRNRS